MATKLNRRQAFLMPLLQLHTEVLEGSMDESQANFQELNAQMTQISQTFARIGDHLQVHSHPP